MAGGGDRGSGQAAFHRREASEKQTTPERQAGSGSEAGDVDDLGAGLGDLRVVVAELSAVVGELSVVVSGLSAVVSELSAVAPAGSVGLGRAAGSLGAAGSITQAGGHLPVDDGLADEVDEQYLIDHDLIR